MALGERIRAGLTGLAKGLFGSTQESGEVAALRAMWDGSNATNLQRGTWYALHSPGSGIRTALLHVCTCGESHKILEAEKFRDYVCRCSRPLDFAGWTGLRLSKNKQERQGTLKRLADFGVSESDYLPGSDGDWLRPDKHEHVLRSVLRVRPNLPENTGPRVVSTWDDSAGEVGYEQGDPAAGSKWR